MMGQSEKNFYKSSIGKVIKMISLHNKYNLGEEVEQVQTITSMKEIEGW